MAIFHRKIIFQTCPDAQTLTFFHPVSFRGSWPIHRALPGKLTGRENLKGLDRQVWNTGRGLVRGPASFPPNSLCQNNPSLGLHHQESRIIPGSVYNTFIYIYIYYYIIYIYIHKYHIPTVFWTILDCPRARYCLHTGENEAQCQESLGPQWVNGVLQIFPSTDLQWWWLWANHSRDLKRLFNGHFRIGTYHI